MKKGIIGLVVLFSVSLFPAYSASPPKAGSACSKQGMTKTYQGKKYTCIKSGKKLVWNKGLVLKNTTPTPSPIPTPTPSPTPTPTPSPTPTPTPSPTPTPTPTPRPVSYGNFLDAEKCKIVDATVARDIQLITSGFERFTYERFKNPFSMRMIVIPVSFANLKFDTSDFVTLKNQNALVSQYFARNSWGNARVDFAIPDEGNWVLLPGNFQDYTQSSVGRTQGISDYLIEEILSRVNKEVVLTDFDIVGFQTSSSKEFYFASGTMRSSSNAFYSKNGPIKDVFGIGGSSTGDWRVIAHELGHNWLGFEDLYNHFTGSLPLGNWDLMSSLTNLELNGWHRWAARWMKDSQVNCLGKDTPALVQVSPLKSLGKTLLVSIPLQSGKSIFLEYRTPSDYYSGPDTLLVYYVDTTIWHGSGPYKLVAELRNQGDSVVFENQSIRLYEKSEHEVYVAINS